jgi:hypothetical protein
MAVILFDNLIEVEIYKQVEQVLLWDNTSWFNGSRKIDKKVRENAIGPSGKYDRLLKLAKDSSLLTEQELEIIKFVHEIRNGIYHRGEDDKLKIEVALMIFSLFVHNKLIEWVRLRHFTVQSSGEEYRKIDFGQPSKNAKGFTPSDKEYFSAAADAIQSKWAITSDLRTIATNLLTRQIDKIASAIEFLNQNLSDLNYYDSLGGFWYLNNQFQEYSQIDRRPRNLDSVLILTLYLRENKEYLADISDLKQRQKEGKKLLRLHRAKYKGKYPYWADLDNLKKRIDLFKGKSSHAIVKNVIDIQNKINNLYLDSLESASHLDGYIQHLIDVSRGK